MISFDRIEIDDTSYEDKFQIGEINIFQTSTWLRYISEIQNAEPVVAAVKSNERFVGYFTGLMTRKFGIKILGSPFRVSLTYFMGFNLLPNAPKREILQALPKFAFKDLGCHYLEIIDPNLLPDHWKGLSYKVEHLHHYGINLSMSENELFDAMDSKGRNKIRQSVKKGVVIEETTDISFADEYYAQFEEVLAKQGLRPTLSLNSVKKLIEYTRPTGNLLLLRAVSPEGICIATGIFLALNKMAIFWGSASWRQYQIFRPNEAIAWYGIKNMKARGIQMLNYGGKCEQYKVKLGAREIQLYRLMQTKYKLLGYFLYPLLSLNNEKILKFRNWILKRVRYYNE